jgi:diguanylate cyclase (GGDEF)-like protein
MKLVASAMPGSERATGASREPMHPTELIRSYLDGVRALAGAPSAALYLPASDGNTPPLLVHSGDREPPEELATLERALAWDRKCEGESVAAASSGLRLGAFPVRTVDGSALIALLSAHAGSAADVDASARRASDRRGWDNGTTRPACPWLGLRYPEPATPREQVEGAIERLPAEVWSWLLTLGSQLSQHVTRLDAAVRDPVTMLLDRGAFYVYLAESVAVAREDHNGLTVLLIHADGLANLNHEHGRSAGDEALAGIAALIPTLLRRTDLVFRYGGAVFAVLLPETDVELGAQVAGTVTAELSARGSVTAELSARGWGAAAAGFQFRAGVAGFKAGVAGFEAGVRASTYPSEGPVDDPLELVRRADQALLAASTGAGDSVSVWSAQLAADSRHSFDRLSGIFTGDTAKDYRNMALLWDSLQILNRGLGVPRLAAESVELFYRSLNPDRALLVSLGERGLEVLHQVTRLSRHGRTASGSRSEGYPGTLSAEDRLLIDRATATGEIQTTSATPEGNRRWAIPALTGGRCLGCLLLAGREDHLRVEDRDRRFLEAVLSQLALALEQSRQAQATLERKEEERQRLRNELGELRDALGNARFLFASDSMAELVQLVHRVAPSDVTVLITGASGTGKELMARTLHELSARKDGPWVVVDCGSIASSLIESELFGHVKGAYTGAGSDRIGRLAQADGGTVLLDEIAELPLEVQSRLLRFVQERQLVSVGSSSPRSVDVRIVAATNRNLPAEVAAGRFREDLYYRLNVIHLQIPPLSQRPSDIPLLARHFVRTFAVQYHKDVRGLAPDAEQALLTYAWPGNVRELQNRVLKAVLLCDGTEIGKRHLGLDRSSAEASADPSPTAASCADTTSGRGRLGGSSATPSQPELGDPATGDGGDACLDLADLRVLLRHQVAKALLRPRPLRRLLSDRLLQAADRLAGGRLRRGADLLGLAETTFRRRLRRLQEKGAPSSEGLPAGDWVELGALLDRVVESEVSASLMEDVETILLEEIERARPARKGLAARLFCVSLPTYRRRLAQLRPTEDAGD